ncbi:MAG: TetR/AcrR family transcriptional regulator [Steroidobacteraceae bacterium]
MSEVAAAYAAREKATARERLLAAADELFYAEGLNTVGIDRVIERAGVAKASLYSIFGSKEELIRAYLQAKHESRKARLEQRLRGVMSPRARLLAVFDQQADNASDPNFRGCAFVRARVELRDGSPVKAVCDQTRIWLKELFVSLAREAGAGDPAGLAEQLSLLYDGATVATQMDGDIDAPRRARRLAETLLDSSVR